MIKSSSPCSQGCKKTCGKKPRKKQQQPKIPRLTQREKEADELQKKIEERFPYWQRERWIKNRTAWMWRLKPFLQKKNEAQCSSCQMAGRCNRIPLDESITTKIAKGKECPDYKSMWNAIVGDQEAYDWGF